MANDKAGSAERVTRIHFEDDRTILSDGASQDVLLTVAAAVIAQQIFRHEPPRPEELEKAIDSIEDALSASGLAQAPRGDLVLQNPAVFERLGLPVSGERITREQLETRFQRLAALSLGSPPARDDPPSDSMAAALLVILRECMHHLGYNGLERDRRSVG